jgi:hypothetical protein
MYANSTNAMLQPMMNAWRYYVDSNNLLNELRRLTKHIPFSSECLDEAKKLVATKTCRTHQRRNPCWLVLVTIEEE